VEPQRISPKAMVRRLTVDDARRRDILFYLVGPVAGMMAVSWIFASLAGATNLALGFAAAILGGAAAGVLGSLAYIAKRHHLIFAL